MSGVRAKESASGLPKPARPASTAAGTTTAVVVTLVAALLPMSAGCGRPPTKRPDPELQALFQEALRLDKEGRHHEALVRYETILGRKPRYVSTRLNAALAAYDSNQFAKAAEHFNILHQYAPRDWFVLRKLIQCYERLGNERKVGELRAKLRRLRVDPRGSLVLKRYKGFTRDLLRVGDMRLIGYEFFDPQKHGRLWYFRLEDREGRRRSAFLLEATPYFEPSGKRLFCLSETIPDRLRVWYVGPEGRSYNWVRDFVLAVLAGKKRPLIVKPLPGAANLWAQAVPGEGGPAAPRNKETEKKKRSPRSRGDRR